MRAAYGTTRGSLLVITLWIMVILGVLAVAVGRQLSMEVRLMKYRRALDQARGLARSGVLLAMARLQDDAKQAEAFDWLQDDWATFPAPGPEASAAVWVVPVPTGARDASSSGGRVEIEIRDEERKLDINTASAAVLGPLIGSPSLAQAIVDYRDQDSDGASESPVETPPYYYPKNGPIIVLEELRDLPDMTADVFDKLQRATFAVPQSGPTTAVNINTASRDVLQAAGLTTLADIIVQFRDQGHYFTSLSPDVKTESPAVPPPFDPGNAEFQNARGRLGVASQLFTVSVTSYVAAPPVRQHLEAVIRRTQGGTEPPRIIAWRES